jgi:hypothetical protein
MRSHRNTPKMALADGFRRPARGAPRLAHACWIQAPGRPSTRAARPARLPLLLLHL